MPGIGPAPKTERRRRNEPTRGDWVDLPPLDKPVLSPLPALEAGPDDEAPPAWRPQTTLTWEAWRRDPVTAQWSPSDIAHALDTILLHNGMTASNANEIRLRMDGLGLTPKGKRDLRWRIAAGDPDSGPARKRPSSVSKRRARLSVVK